MAFDFQRMSRFLVNLTAFQLVTQISYERLPIIHSQGQTLENGNICWGVSKLKQMTDFFTCFLKKNYAFFEHRFAKLRGEGVNLVLPPPPLWECLCSQSVLVGFPREGRRNIPKPFQGSVPNPYRSQYQTLFLALPPRIQEGAHLLLQCSINFCTFCGSM